MKQWAQNRRAELELALAEFTTAAFKQYDEGKIEWAVDVAKPGDTAIKFTLTMSHHGFAGDARTLDGDAKGETTMRTISEKPVITWQASSGLTLNICATCEDRLTQDGTWPKDGGGREYAQVSYGRHWGYCDICEDKEKRQ